MEPQFRFCPRADGSRIQYATYGEGPRIFYVPLTLSVDSALNIPESRALLGGLASRMTLATCDASVTYMDIVAVAESLGWGDFALFANNDAILHVARLIGSHRQLVTRLIWWNTVYAGMVGANSESQYVRAVRGSADDYSNYRRRVVSNFFPDGPVRLQREYNNAWKTLSVERTVRWADRLARTRVDDFLPPIATPALVLARSGRVDERATVMRLAGLMPNSELRFVAGNSGEPFPEHEPVVEAIAQFMGLDNRPSQGTSGTAIILFADIVDSTAITGRIGNAAFRERSLLLEDALRAAIRNAGGAPVEGRTLGDGVLGDFSSAAQAIEAAVACGQTAKTLELALHLGLHAGDVIREAGNVYGVAVSVASRVSGLSGPNEILVSSTVRDLARGSADVMFEDRGEHALKGVEEPQRLYAVRLQS